MSRSITFLFFAISSLSLAPFSRAQIRLPAIVSSDMVLQRDTDVSLWGWADAKAEISIEASWLETPLVVRADKEGNWKTSVRTTNSKDPQTIKLSSNGHDLMLNNVLFGEVWICSGQSNMQQPVKGFKGQPTFGSTVALLNSNNRNLRLFTVDRVGGKMPLDDLEKFRPWQEASPENVAEFSAVAYFFGQQLQEVLDVPVGIIHTSWGASSVQTWMSKEALEVFQKIDVSELGNGKKGNKVPTALFNAMVNPLIPYTMKGVLWYQGEANRREPEKYKELFPAMVKDWRSRWDIGDFPIYFVQIAPFTYGNKEAFKGAENTAFMREAQLACVDLIPNSGIAITLDVGDPKSIHPPKKKEVADRLLFNALSQTYGLRAFDGASPVVDSLIVKEREVLLKFKLVKNGLYAQGILEGFEIAGEDHVFYPAKARIVKLEEVLVSSDQVLNPMAVRYAWRNWVEGTLFTTSMLPVSSFRTDDWNDATRAKQ